MISMIVAHDLNKGIGLNNALPWSIKEDMEHFKMLTIGKAVIMGRNTFESMGRKDLPQRMNIIVSSKGDEYQKEIIQSSQSRAFVCKTLDEAIEFARNIHSEIMIIGGSQLYESAAKHANRVYVTEILQELEADKQFVYPPRMREIYASPVHSCLNRMTGKHVDLKYKIFSK